MAENFLNQINSAYDKGWKVNPNFQKAKNAIEVMAKGENTIDKIIDRDGDEIEV